MVGCARVHWHWRMRLTSRRRRNPLLQADIEACDRHGGGNHDVSPDEHIEDWVACVVAAASKEDVDLLVLPLLSA